MMQAVPMFDDVTAVVLAGGRSSRFGSDKLAFEIDGRTMLDHAVAAVGAVTSHVILVLAPGTEMPLALASSVAGHVHDSLAFEGPLAALAAALEVIETPVALVVAGDMPRMVPAVLQRLASTAGADRPAVNLEVHVACSRCPWRSRSRLPGLRWRLFLSVASARFGPCSRNSVHPRSQLRSGSVWTRPGPRSWT